MKKRNRYRVVLRRSTVVEEDYVSAKTMIGAAKRATKLWPDWSVYSITLM